MVVRLDPQLQDGRGHAELHPREQRRQPDEPVRFAAAQLHGQHEVPDQQEQSAVGLLDLQQEVPAAPRRRHGAAAAGSDAQAAVAEEPVQRQLDVGDGPEHVPRGVVQLLPHALAEHLVRRVQRAAGRPAALDDVQHRLGRLHRRPGADRAAFPRLVPLPDECRRDTLPRRPPRRRPSAENGIRELVRLGHGRLPDLQRHAPPLQRPGGDVQRHGPDRLRPERSLGIRHAARPGSEDAQFRRLRPGSSQLRALHRQPRPALVVLRRQDSGAAGRRRPVVPGDHLPRGRSRLLVEYVRAADRAGVEDHRPTARTSPRRATAAITR